MFEMSFGLSAVIDEHVGINFSSCLDICLDEWRSDSSEADFL